MRMLWSIGVAAAALVAPVFAVSAAEEAAVVELKKGYSEADYKAAYGLLEAMEIPRSLQESLENMLDLQLRSNPQMQPMRQVMLEFFQKYLSYDALKTQLADLYLDSFTIQEVKELTAFYQTPLGKMIALKTPQLTARSAEIGQKAVMAHLPELQAAILKAMQEQSAPKPAEAPAGEK